MSVMFATDLSDESTYDTICAIDSSSYMAFCTTLPLHIENATNTGYIVLSHTGNYIDNLTSLYYLNIENAVADDDDCSEFEVGYSGAIDNVPVCSNYDASYSVQIYTADELKAQGYQAGYISNIAFYQVWCDDPNTLSKYQKSTTVWMGNTDKESFNSNSDWISGLTQVMNETAIDFNKNGGCVDLPLDVPFYWDGESNLAVAVLAYSDSYTYMYFRGGKTDNVNRAICAFQDNITPTVNNGVPTIENSYFTTNRTNIKLCYTQGAEKEIVKDNVTYTISGFENDKMIIEKASFNESDLTPVNFDITYSSSTEEDVVVTDFLTYKRKIDVPTTLTDDDVTYTIVATRGDAFDDNTLTDTVRVNILAGTIIDAKPANDKIILCDDSTLMLYNGNSYKRSLAYKVNLCDGATMKQRPFGEQPLKISSPSVDEESETSDGSGVFRTFTGARLSCPEGGVSETDASDKNMLEALLDEDEVTIDIMRLSKIRIAETATNIALDEFVDENCDEVMFQADLVEKKYPECSVEQEITLDKSAAVKAEFALNNKEYYYFSLPFDCDDIKVMAETDDEAERSNSISEALSHEDNVNRYVLFKWDESAYTSNDKSGYVEFNGTTLEKNKGYVIAIVESAKWYSEHESNYETSSLNATVTFTASNYTEIASSDSVMEISVSRASATNIYSGWNLVGNPFYGAVKSSQYSFNKYVRKVIHDYGSGAQVDDYAPNISVLNAEIKPFETVFIQKSDMAGNGTVTVTGTSPVQQVQGAPAILPEYITITLNDSNRMIDRTTIINNTLSSDDFRQEEDLVKSHQNSNEIYTKYGDSDFSFNEMNICDSDKIIPLAVKVAAEGNYTIAMSSGLSNFGTGEVFLHDKTLETYINLSDGEVETLRLTEGTTEGRLEISIKVNEVITITDNIEDDLNGIEVYMQHGIATIEGVEEGATVTITDATGKTLYTAKAAGDRIDYQFMVRGVYMITVRNNDSVRTVKMVY